MKQIFVNLPVRDLNTSIEFFTNLGFTFNPQFTDQNATCMVLGDNLFAMLLVPEFFKKFTKKEIADTSKVTEVITALAAESREQVDAIARKAVESGGKIHRDPDDQGWMYTQSIEDLDGHIWEIMYMDEAKIPVTP